jgi:hypothetical protein
MPAIRTLLDGFDLECKATLAALQDIWKSKDISDRDRQILELRVGHLIGIETPPRTVVETAKLLRISHGDVVNAEGKAVSLLEKRVPRLY